MILRRLRVTRGFIKEEKGRGTTTRGKSKFPPRPRLSGVSDRVYGLRVRLACATCRRISRCLVILLTKKIHRARFHSRSFTLKGSAAYVSECPATSSLTNMARRCRSGSSLLLSLPPPPPFPLPAAGAIARVISSKIFAGYGCSAAQDLKEDKKKEKLMPIRVARRHTMMRSCER